MLLKQSNLQHELCTKFARNVYNTSKSIFGHDREWHDLCLYESLLYRQPTLHREARYKLSNNWPITA